MKNIFEKRADTVPVWFMRQAGRYHSHYQAMKKKSDFMSMCKNPEEACEVTLGPIQDFKFNAAILFSDLLFPLEHLGMDLVYNPGPKLGWQLEKTDDLKCFHRKSTAADFFKFQGDATKLLKERLPQDVSLLGFVGAPFTLYAYAVEGSHAGNLVSTKRGFYDGRYEGFVKLLFPELLEEMFTQARNGADAIALFDTAAGELCSADFKEFIVPHLSHVMKTFKEKFSQTKIIYYSKHTQWNHLQHLDFSCIDVIGVDWRCDLVEIQSKLPKHLYIQGNIDPTWLHLDGEIMAKKIRAFYQDLKTRGLDMSRWICGLGHGVLIETPEENVRNAVKIIQNEFKI